ncbi:sulfatase, partial [Chloroflexota bacterium]
GSTTDVVEGSVIGALSGVGLAVLSVYALNMGIGKQKLIAIGISLVAWILVFLYGGLWVNLSLLSREAFFTPMSLLSNAGFLLLVGLLALGLYILSLLILQRFAPWRTRKAAYTLLAVMLCASIAISFLGPFSFENIQEAGASDAGEIGVVVGSENLRGKPNILWIVMDTVRADHLSCYDYHRNTTPNIDRVASEGILFENAISAAPWTLPSHASMFTGLFPSKHGADTEHRRLDDDFQTIAEVLRSYGYRTFGYSNNSMAVNERVNLNQGFDIFEVTTMGKDKVWVSTELADKLKVNIARPEVHDFVLMDDGARETNEVVKRWIADAHQAETPFFVFINYMEAHGPYYPPESYARPFLGEGVSWAEAMSVNQDCRRYITGQVEMGAEDFEILRALYDGEISYLDFRMGQ